jgi:hypothetical protein
MPFDTEAWYPQEHEFVGTQKVDILDGMLTGLLMLLLTIVNIMHAISCL